MFLSMSIISLYLLGRSKAFSQPTPGRFAIAFLCLTPIILATFVAVSRPANHKHHFSDINAGMAIGLLTGTFAYFLNYPSILSPDSGQPKHRFHSSLPAAAPTTPAASKLAAAAAPPPAAAGSRDLPGPARSDEEEVPAIRARQVDGERRPDPAPADPASGVSARYRGL
jgi:hypothetical protein